MGASIGYWQGDVLKLLDDVGALKPALFLGVPRVFDRIYARVVGMVGLGYLILFMRAAANAWICTPVWLLPATGLNI